MLPADLIPFVYSSIYFWFQILNFNSDGEHNLESYKNMKHLLTFILRDCQSGVEKDRQKTDIYDSMDESAAEI